MLVYLNSPIREINHMLNQMTTVKVLLFLILLSAFMITCSDNTPTEPNGGGTDGVITFNPIATTGQAISWVELSGLPNDSTKYSGIVTPLTTSFSASVVGDTGYTYVMRTDSGDFMIILHGFKITEGHFWI